MNAQVSSIGSIGGAKNANIVESLSGVIERRLGVPPDRCYINVSALGYRIGVWIL